ncbi:MAG: ABC transporter permease [Bryobacteraceae bacterium]
MSRRKRMLSRLEHDIQDHIERETLDNIARGMPPDEARYAAVRAFGNIQLVKERAREVWIAAVVDEIVLDVRFGLRILRRDPGFAAVSILTLAIGIAVSTAIFSVINTVLLQPLPYPQANRIVAFSDVPVPGAGRFKPGIAGSDFAVWEARAASFEALAGYFYSDETVSSSEMAQQLRVVSVAGDFWPLTGAHALFGQLFTAREEKLGPVAVLSYACFQREFGGDRSIIGKIIEIDGRPVTVEGVLPKSFGFFFSQDWWSGLGSVEPSVYVPATPLSRAKPSRLFVAGRLRGGRSVAAALTELRGIEGAILKEYPDRWFPGVSRMALVPLDVQLVGNNRWALMILQIAGLFVLIIACANVANLLLARGAARGQEIAIRTAIGAGATRVLRQFLVEGMALALLGGAAGLLLAQAIVLLLVRYGPASVPRLNTTSLDGMVLTFTFGLCLGSGILFSAGPAAVVFRTNVQNALKDGATRSVSGPSRIHIRPLLVALELALSIVLLTGAGLMIKSFWKMYTNPPGFAPKDSVVMKVALSGPQYTERGKQVAYFNRLLERIGSLPGVKAFGIADGEDYIVRSKRPVPPPIDEFRDTLVSPGYFQAIGMRLLKGRWLTNADGSDASVINETMARRAFGNRDPLGGKIDGLGRPIRVVGVVANLKYAKLDADPGPELFRLVSPNLEGGNTTMTVAVRMFGDALGLAPNLRSSASRVDPAQPVYDVQSLDHMLSATISTRRFELILLGLFAASAIVMAIVGVYGVISYSVTQRVREIGIRLALGAERGTVLQMVIGQGLLIGWCGIASGIAAAYGLTRLMGSLLYGVSPNDPAVFAAAAVFLGAVVALASWIPGAKAANVDPLVALRYE